MQQNGESIAKKIWDIVTVAFFMIRKGICKGKILLDLNMMMKRRKLAGKSLRNLIPHGHHHSSATAAANSNEFEFISCNKSLLYRPTFFTHSSKRKPHHFDDADAVNNVLEMMMMTSSSNNGVASSPILGFGRSPMTRQLRVTDSPYPLQNDPEESKRINKAAEDFIKKFHTQLKSQQDC